MTEVEAIAMVYDRRSADKEEADSPRLSLEVARRTVSFTFRVVARGSNMRLMTSSISTAYGLQYFPARMLSSVSSCTD
jgi:hypothetical protein